MNCLFVNPHERNCGVNAFGLNLYEILRASNGLRWQYLSGAIMPPMRILRCFDIILYNHHSLIGGWQAQAPFDGLGTQCLIFHDCEVRAECWPAILFADPTMAPHDNWHPIGRPIPNAAPTLDQNLIDPIIGVHGFKGAWADRVLDQVLKEFEHATVRMALPFAWYGDRDGAQALQTAETCKKLAGGTGIHLEISHDFLPQPKLIEWLSSNTLNCYFRDPDWVWRGVASAPDVALAARRPIAVNGSNSFRHLHGTSPSIRIEDNSLTEIIRNGFAPLEPLCEQWSAEKVRAQVESILYSAAAKPHCQC